MLTIRQMTITDLPLGMRLKTEARWNQVEADWRRFLALEPDGCFVAELDGAPAGTLTTCVLGEIAWIAMVLVDARLRGQGIGTALMSHALAYLDARGVPSVRLDATPLGQPLYEKLGFAAEYTVARFEGAPAPPAGATAVLPYDAAHFDAVDALDRQVTGTDRRRLLAALLAEQREEARLVTRDGAVTGYLVSRPGTRAWQIGPCIATDAESGARLLADAFARHAGTPVFLDVPEANAPAVAAAVAAGLTVQRPFLRMCRGPLPADRVNGIWASSGPEKG